MPVSSRGPACDGTNRKRSWNNVNRAERGLADPRESVGQTTTESLIDRLRSGHVEIRKQAIERSVHSADDVIVACLIQLVQEGCDALLTTKMGRIWMVFYQI